MAAVLLFSVLIALASVLYYQDAIFPAVIPSDIPKHMKALRILNFGTIKNIPTTVVSKIKVPTPGPGEVLIKVEAAPINPSDIIHASGHGRYKVNDGFGVGMPFGIEGSGIVVAAGAGFLPRLRLGRRVAFASDMARGGSYAQYVIIPALNVMDLPDDVSYSTGAGGVVNPMTVEAMIDTFQREGHKAMIHTAAASALGKMLLKRCLHLNIPLINVVRREEQKQLLVEVGADPSRVLVSTDAFFDANLTALARELGATIAFDAVGGKMPLNLFPFMPDRSTVYVYGALTVENMTSVPTEFYARGQVLKGLLLSDWFENTGLLKLVECMRRASFLLNTDYKTEYVGNFTLETAMEGYGQYYTKKTNSKFLILPQE